MNRIKKLRKLMVLAFYLVLSFILLEGAKTVRWYSMKSGYYEEYDEKVSIPVVDVPHPRDGIDYYYRDHYIVRMHSGAWPDIIKDVKVHQDRYWLRWDKPCDCETKDK